MSRLRQWLSQLQLSLFGDNGGAVVDVVDGQLVRSPKPVAKTKTESTTQSKPVIRPNVQSPVSTTAEVQTPETPTGKVRTVMLNAQLVPYVLERTRRRTVGMVIDHAGLRVRASPAVSVLEIERILQSRAAWIVKSLYKVQNTTARTSFVPDLQVADGETLPILGRDVRVFWLTSAGQFNAQTWLSTQFERTDDVPALMLRDVPQAKRERALLNALGAILLEYLFRRAHAYAQAHGLRYRVIALSSARTLWGTCRSDGALRLNWRLVFLDTELVDYVLAHELSHTVHMNHSRLFWAQVAQLCPDYKARVQRLKQYNLRAT